jgi:hypothetical protein
LVELKRIFGLVVRERAPFETFSRIWYIPTRYLEFFSVFFDIDKSSVFDSTDESSDSKRVVGPEPYHSLAEGSQIYLM